MARWTSCSWIEGKRFVVLVCSSTCFSLSEETNTHVGFGYMAQFSSQYIGFSHFLVFCQFNVSLWVINVGNSSINSFSRQVAVRMQISGLCYWTLITGLGKEIRGLVGKGNKRICRKGNKRTCCIPLFWYMFIVLYSVLKGKNHVVFCWKGAQQKSTYRKMWLCKNWQKNASLECQTWFCYKHSFFIKLYKFYKHEIWSPVI